MESEEKSIEFLPKIKIILKIIFFYAEKAKGIWI
jgi:hypothetical protein